MKIEKRRFPRASIVCKITAVFAERLLVFNSHTENIGEGGIRVILEEKLHISTEVEVELFLLDRERPLKCKGQVIWTEEISPVGTEPRFFDTGIEFMGISDPDQTDVRKLVNALLAQEQGEKGLARPQNQINN